MICRLTWINDDWYSPMHPSVGFGNSIDCKKLHRWKNQNNQKGLYIWFNHEPTRVFGPSFSRHPSIWERNWMKDNVSMKPWDLYWLAVWNITFIFPYIGNVIIPTNELIFFRGVGPGRYTTNQIRNIRGFLVFPVQQILLRGCRLGILHGYIAMYTMGF